MDSNSFDSIKSKYFEDGFVVIRNIIEKEVISNLLIEMQQALSNPNLNRNRDIHYLNGTEISSMHNLADYSTYFRGFIQSSKINDIFKWIYGESKDFIFNSSYFAKPKKIGIATKPHQDNAFFCMDPPEAMTCWFPVDFADERNGALYYFKGSHKEGNIEHEPEGNAGASMCINEGMEKTIIKKYCRNEVHLSVTDCVLHSPLVVHGSYENKSEFDRKAFNFSIASKNAVQNKVLFEKYKKNLDQF